MVDVTGDLEIQEDGGVTVQTEVASLGELTISTHGRGEVVSGSVTVISDGPIGGVLRFDLPGIGVAGVGASPPVRDALFPARRQAGGIRTAAALRNLSESELRLTCRLMKDGEELEDQPVTLPANGQDAMFIDEMFEYDTSTSQDRSVARRRQGSRSSPEWPWSWIPETASSPHCRWCRFGDDLSAIVRMGFLSWNHLRVPTRLLQKYNIRSGLSQAGLSRQSGTILRVLMKW